MCYRRHFLQTATGLFFGSGLLGMDRVGIAAGATPPSDDPAPTSFSDRTLWLHRVQTQEEGRVLYFQDQSLVPDGYSLLCYLLRDVHAEQVTRMDVKLIHLLFGMQAWMRSCGIRQPLRINSGYRTPETNAHTEGSAVHSQHLRGQAVDFTVEGIPSPVLAKLALKFNAGGVGVYPAFVHVDTGPVRVWRG